MDRITRSWLYSVAFWPEKCSEVRAICVRACLSALCLPHLCVRRRRVYSSQPLTKNIDATDAHWLLYSTGESFELSTLCGYYCCSCTREQSSSEYSLFGTRHFGDVIEPARTSRLVRAVGRSMLQAQRTHYMRLCECAGYNSARFNW